MSAQQFHAEVMAELEQEECAYCGRPVPDGIHATQFECCGEIGHTTGEAKRFLDEQDAARASRPLADDEFRRRIEEMHPWLKQWEKGQLT